MSRTRAAALAAAAVPLACWPAARPTGRRRPRLTDVDGSAAPGRVGRPVPLRRGHPQPQGRRHQQRRPRHPGQPGHHLVGRLRVPHRAAHRRRRAPRADRRLHDRVRRGAVRPAAGHRAGAGRGHRRPHHPAAAARGGPGAAGPAAREGLRGRSVLDRAATVHLRLATSTETLRGEEYLPGRLVLRHRPGATGPVRVVDLGGSVLLDLVPRAGRDALPGRAARRTRTVLAFPVLMGSAHRCDPHALGQSSQTFLISAYVRLGSDPVATGGPAAVHRGARPADRDPRPRLPLSGH